MEVQKTEERIKVVLLCHFSNPYIRERIPLSSNRLENLSRRLRGLSPLSYNDYATWNYNTIEGLKEEKDIELHVIFPHYGLKSWTYECQADGVNYHVYRPEPLYPWNSIEIHLKKSQKTDLKRTRQIVGRWIRAIKPDLVNLVGAENQYYSVGGLEVDNIPLFITCQTIYSNPERKKLSGEVSRFRWDLEQSLFAKTKYFSCTNTMYRDLIKSYVPDAFIFPLVWSMSSPPQLEDCKKKYDFAFFAFNVSAKKGIDSAIEALGIVKKTKKNVTLLVVGKTDEDYKKVIERRISDLELTDNIIFHDFFPLQIDMLNYVHQARFALLPVKMDFLSGTILQAMEMGMPVISHITSGTPTLNEERETALLSEIGDVNTMAQQMLRLMDDDNLATILANNGRLFIQKRYEKAAQGVKQRVEQYKAIISHFRYGESIPQSLLFNSSDSK